MTANQSINCQNADSAIEMAEAKCTNDRAELQAEITALLDRTIADCKAVAATAIVTFEDGRQWKISGVSDPAKFSA